MIHNRIKSRVKTCFRQWGIGLTAGMLLLAPALSATAHHDDHSHHQEVSGHGAPHLAAEPRDQLPQEQRGNGHQHGHAHSRGHEHEHGAGPGAHVHGQAEINLVLEGSMLVIDMLSPGINKVGFEHQPRNPEQRRAIAKAKELLTDGDKLFALPAAARCRQVRVEISSDFDRDHGHDHGPDHGGHEHEHDRGHGHGHGGHEHKNGHKDGRDHDHANFMGLWEFHCEQPERLGHIDFRFFEQFPATQRLRIQAITPGGQTGADLRPPNTRLDL